MTTRWKGLVLAVAVCSVSAGPGVSARQAATPPSTAQPQESRTTAQLLEEVRALRAAIERMTVSGTRAQLLLGRLQMQEQRMTSLGRQLQETRGKLANLQRDRQAHASEVESLTQGLDRASTPDERSQIEMNIKAITQSLKQLDQQVGALQTEDVGVSQALLTEQGRWVELNGRLEELEGMLATQRP